MSLFETFKFSPVYTQLEYVQSEITRTPPSSLASSHSPNRQYNRSHTPAESFKRGIKRDLTICNTFKEGN